MHTHDTSDERPQHQNYLNNLTNLEQGTVANLTLGSDAGLAGTAEDDQSANASCSAQMLLTGDSCYAPSCSYGAETARAPLSLPQRTQMRLNPKSAHICRF